ncbi:MAG: hypothetical protein ACR2PT_05440 [Endozoicomonas sp.]
MSEIKWVKPRKLAEETGYTEKAILNKIDRGVWTQGKMWRKAPDGIRLINRQEYDKWVESQPQI